MRNRLPVLTLGLIGFVIVGVAVALVQLALGGGGSVEGCGERPTDAPTIQALDLASAQDAGVFAPSDPIAAREGPPIGRRDSDAALAMLDAGSRTLRYPVAGLGACVVLIKQSFSAETGRATEEFVVWHPESGNSASVPGTNRSADERSDRRIEAVSGEWLIVRNSPQFDSSGRRDPDTIVAIHHRTGETRTVAQPAPGTVIGRFAGSGRLVAWAETEAVAAAGRVQRIRLYDVVTDAHLTLIESPYDQQHFTFEPPLLAGSVVAWTDSDSISGGALYVARMTDVSLSRYRLGPTFGRLQGLSDDGRNLLWTDRNERQISTDLQSGESVGYAEAGNAEVVGSHAAFSQESDTARRGLPYEEPLADGGLYGASSREVRTLEEQDGCLCLTLGVRGDWFVWLDGAPIPPQSGREPIPTGTLRFMKLD